MDSNGSSKSQKSIDDQLKEVDYLIFKAIDFLEFVLKFGSLLDKEKDNYPLEVIQKGMDYISDILSVLSKIFEENECDCTAVQRLCRNIMYAEKDRVLIFNQYVSDAISSIEVLNHRMNANIRKGHWKNQIEINHYPIDDIDKKILKILKEAQNSDDYYGSNKIFCLLETRNVSDSALRGRLSLLQKLNLITKDKIRGYRSNT